MNSWTLFQGASSRTTRTTGSAETSAIGANWFSSYGGLFPCRRSASGITEMDESASSTRPVLDDDALLQDPLHRDGGGPPGKLGDAARRERHDHRDWAGRVGVLRERGNSQERQSNQRNPLAHAFLQEGRSILPAQSSWLKRPESSAAGGSAIR